MTDPTDEERNRSAHRSIHLALAAGRDLTARWGGIELTPAGIAVVQRSRTVTLTVYPPGITHAERALMTLRYAANSWLGALLALFLTVIVVSLPHGGLLGIAISACFLLVLWIACTVPSDRVNANTHRLRLRVGPTGIAGPFDQWNHIAHQLEELDATPGLNPVEYEAEWGRIYQQLAR